MVSSEVKTKQNWLFSISALRLLSECSWPFSFKGATPFVVLNFFVPNIQKVCFSKKDLMAGWVCGLHNLYFAQRSALFVRSFITILKKTLFYGVDSSTAELRTLDKVMPILYRVVAVVFAHLAEYGPQRAQNGRA